LRAANLILFFCGLKTSFFLIEFYHKNKIHLARFWLKHKPTLKIYK